MSRRQSISAMAVAAAALAVAAPMAQADAPSGQRVTPLAIQPDGYQPQLATSPGSASHPDNLYRSRPPALVPAGPTASGFDWGDGAAGAAAGVALLLLAGTALLAIRGRTRLVHERG